MSTDDPYTRIRGVAPSVERAARAALDAGAPPDQVVYLVTEIGRWKTAWAQGKVDKEREVRAAAARALDCDQHGRAIAELEQQLHSAGRQAAAADRSRSAYLMGLHNLTTGIDALRARLAAGDTTVPTLDVVADKLAAALTEIRANGDIHHPRKRPREAQQLDLFQDAA